MPGFVGVYATSFADILADLFGGHPVGVAAAAKEAEALALVRGLVVVPLVRVTLTPSVHRHGAPL